MVGDWGKWSHPDHSTPETLGWIDSSKTERAENIWGDTYHEHVLHVHRSRPIVMKPVGTGQACPGTLEWKPWQDHCVQSMGREKNDRNCDISKCTKGSDGARCHHHAERCDDKAYARLTVKYSYVHKCSEVGWYMSVDDDAHLV